MPEPESPPVRIQVHGRFAVAVDGRPVEHLLPAARIDRGRSRGAGGAARGRGGGGPG